MGEFGSENMDKKYKASVIIPTYNKLAYLKLTMCSILKIEELQEIQIVIVNDGSDDGTKEYLDEYQIFDNFEIVSTKNHGRSYARNRGVQFARSNLLIFVDDDVLIDKTFIEEHIKSHKHKNIIVHGKIYEMPSLKAFSNPSEPVSADGKRHKNLEKYLLQKKDIMYNFSLIAKRARLSKFEKDILELCGNNDFVDYRWISSIGANTSMQKETYEKVGGFDESLGKTWGCEDLEFGYRGALSNVEFLTNEEACVYHMTHFRENSQKNHQKAMYYFYRKYNDWKLAVLNQYFMNEIPNLLFWAKKCEEGERENRESYEEYFRDSKLL